MTRTFESGPAVDRGDAGDPPPDRERPAPKPAVKESDEVRSARAAAPRLVVDRQPITVIRLIEMLQLEIACDRRVANLTVFSEGCDCWGETFGIEISVEGGHVLIARDRS